MKGVTKQGVRDLNSLPGPPKQQKSGKVYDGEILSDLIYADTRQIRDVVSGRFPEATFDGDYDEIHGDRLSVGNIRCSRIGYYKFLIGEKMAGISLLFQLAIYEDEKGIVEALDSMDPRWRERSKKAAKDSP